MTKQPIAVWGAWEPVVGAVARLRFCPLLAHRRRFLSRVAPVGLLGCTGPRWPPPVTRQLGPPMTHRRHSLDSRVARRQSHSYLASGLFDHLVGADEERQRKGDAERFGGLQINDQLKLRSLHNRQVGRLVALENPPSIETSLA